MFKRTAALLIAAALVAPAASGGYVLHHPRREHCRRGYVRHTRGHRIVCLRPAHRVAPTPPKAPPAPSAVSPAPPVTPSTLPPTSVAVTPPEPSEGATCGQWVEWMRQVGYTAQEIAEYTAAEGCDESP